MAYGTRLLPGLLLAFLMTLGLAWPDLPLNARLSDLLFPALVMALAVAARPWPAAHRLDAVVLLYLAGGLPSLLATTDLQASGVELLRQVYLIAIYAATAVAVARGYGTLVAAGVALGGIGLAGAGLACVLLVQIAGSSLPGAGHVMALPYVGEVIRLRAFTVSEAMLACLLTMSVPCALALQEATPRGRAAWAWALAAGLGTVASLLTFAVAAAGVLVAIVFVLWSRVGARPVWRGAALAAAVAAVVLLNLTVVASVRTVRVGQTVLADRTAYHYGVDEGRVAAGPLQIDYAVMSYARLKTLALEAFVEHPLTGVGLDRFHDVSERAYEAGRLTADYRAIDPHSTLPGRLAETGVAGGITLLLLWWAFGVAGLQLVRAGGADGWLALAATAGLAGLLVNSVNVDVMNLRFLWVGLGVVRGLSPPDRGRAG